MSRFFVHRPIFAWVIAILAMLLGTIAIFTLPIAQYPSIAPPSISVSAAYPGASSETLERTVTQVIEQQMRSLDHLEYIASTSDSSGAATVTLTFAPGTNPDIAQVQVQNKLQLATPLLPQQVQQRGLTVAKAGRNFLLVVALYSANGAHSSAELGDYIVSKLQDPISRVDGVGDMQVFGSQAAMRIWLDPYKLYKYALTVGDVKAAIQAQNAQVSAGQIGGMPSQPGQQISAIVTAQSRLSTPDQFSNILLKTNADGSSVLLRDVARVERGQDDYGTSMSYNGVPAEGFAIKLAPGANALRTADAVKAKLAELSKASPPDFRYAYAVDTTPFVRLSIEDVVKTLFEAIALVFVVMFVFLQNWRATLIPTIAVPVVLLGTFGVLAALGYSINTLTMFALVLSIGLLVDDAIVVVENVERIMHEEGLGAREATLKSMREITGALVGIALVLSAVFLPMAFFGGSTGVIYRQFAVTIVSAMALSVAVALILTPALCATLLKPAPRRERGFFGWFNRSFDNGAERYRTGLARFLARRRRYMLVYGALVVGLGLLFVRLPTGFLPDEDQGQFFGIVQLPPGATIERTSAVAAQIDRYMRTKEQANLEGFMTVSGFSFAGSGQNAALIFGRLTDWGLRQGWQNKAQVIAGRSMGGLSQVVRDARVFVFIPPSVPELGNSNGFDMELEDVGGVGHDRLVAAEGQLLGMAAKDPSLVAVRPNGLPDTPQVKVDVDQARAGALGVPLADINDTLSTAWGGVYVDDFLDNGRVKRVWVQGDAPFRSTTDDLGRWFVRAAGGTMTPFSAFAASHWVYGGSRLERYNGRPSLEIVGQAAPGVSTGAAMAEMEKLVQRLPSGVGLEWTNVSYEEKAAGAQAPLLYALSILVVFLFLAALYESWTIPLSVILVVPLGVLGAVIAATLRGLDNDIYFQVGLLTTMGLSAKNAILIVEFAGTAQRAGKAPLEAVMEAARLRLRPILMTSIAFIAGVLPLALSQGAGSGAQNDIGTGVIGGMAAATLLAIFFVPLFFVVARSLFTRRPEPMAQPEPDASPQNA